MVQGASIARAGITNVLPKFIENVSALELILQMNPRMPIDSHSVSLMFDIQAQLGHGQDPKIEGSLVFTALAIPDAQRHLRVAIDVTEPANGERAIFAGAADIEKIGR